MLVTIEKIIIETEVMRVAFLERFFRGLKFTKCTRDYLSKLFFSHYFAIVVSTIMYQNIVFEAK